MSGTSPVATGEGSDVKHHAFGGFVVADRDNHYEAAFEAYLRQQGVPYIAVDETRRSVMADGQSIKSLVL